MLDFSCFFIMHYIWYEWLGMIVKIPVSCTLLFQVPRMSYNQAGILAV